MKKGEIVEGVIERIQFPNKGIMSVEDTNCKKYNTGAEGELPHHKKEKGKS